MNTAFQQFLVNARELGRWSVREKAWILAVLSLLGNGYQYLDSSLSDRQKIHIKAARLGEDKSVVQANCAPSTRAASETQPRVLEDEHPAVQPASKLAPYDPCPALPLRPPPSLLEPVYEFDNVDALKTHLLTPIGFRRTSDTGTVNAQLTFDEPWIDDKVIPDLNRKLDEKEKEARNEKAKNLESLSH